MLYNYSMLSYIIQESISGRHKNPERRCYRVRLGVRLKEEGRVDSDEEVMFVLRPEQRDGAFLSVLLVLFLQVSVCLDVIYLVRCVLFHMSCEFRSLLPI